MNGTCRECGRAGQIKRGLCIAHYTAWWRGRSPEERRRPTTAERYWAKVDQRGTDECWPWTGSRRESGHGIFCVTRTERVPAGCYALYLYDGTERPDELHVLHHCDNPPCVNPRHLYYGTPADNAHDRVTRAREPLGEARPNARMTADLVVELRERFAAGELNADLAAEVGISTGLLSRIVNGLVWRSVGGPRTSRKDQRGTTKATDIRPGCLKDALLTAMRESGAGDVGTRDALKLLRASSGHDLSAASVLNALAGLATRGYLIRVAPGRYRLEQVAVGRSFASSEREADRLHATDGRA